ncbi:hypothetical protein [Vreelandella neptunia]|uniref:Uncharacterized protein n=1 Tax=Vreelandella neptunia TaxID=115551 RepID=A0ABZ0YSK2_9GAMM|nr:hypothetical protein [Halomonas neptunia]MDN3561672.1 hypothetical protein [Halomonas neptunia]WQH14574.1 hypothetical protein SR894_08555 [Halomonas neptunia]
MSNPSIDPEKLLELCRKRHNDGGVTLSWPSMLQIVEQLRLSNALVAKLELINSQRHLHAHQKWAHSKGALDKFKEGCQ